MITIKDVLEYAEKNHLSYDVDMVWVLTAISKSRKDE